MIEILRSLCCFWQQGRTRNVEHKVLILGLENAGKTSLLYKWVTQAEVTTVPTIGYNVEQVRWESINFLIWDIGGQKLLRPAWHTYFPDTEIVIIVIDSTDADLLPVVKYELQNILVHEELEKAAFLILANKQDDATALNVEEISKRLELDVLSSRVWRIQPCSAKTGHGMDEALMWMKSTIKRR